MSGTVVCSEEVDLLWSSAGGLLSVGQQKRMEWEGSGQLLGVAPCRGPPDRQEGCVHECREEVR